MPGPSGSKTVLAEGFFRHSGLVRRDSETNEISTDAVNWLPICTNTVLKGSAQYVDPNGSANPGIFYRIFPVDAPANY